MTSIGRRRAIRDARDAAAGRLGFGRRRVLQHEIDTFHRNHILDRQRPPFMSPYDETPIAQTVASHNDEIGSAQAIATDVTGKIGRPSTAAPMANNNNNDAADNESTTITRDIGNISNADYWRAARAGRDPTLERHHRDAREAQLAALSQRAPCRTSGVGNGNGNGHGGSDDVYGATAAITNVSNGISVSGRPFSHRGYWQQIRHPSSVIPTTTTTGIYHYPISCDHAS